MKEYIFAPSLLSANFMKLSEELDKCVDNGVE
jgi:pentose-5-phosphate-3-epimerase